jgi:hypothetical protein
MTETYEVRLEFPNSDLVNEQQASETDISCHLGEPKSISPPHGAGISSAHFVDPVTLVGVVTLAWLANRMVNHWIKSKEQGVQIDLRDKPPIISRIAGVPAGFLVIINQEGEASSQKVDYDKPEDLMPLLKHILVPV